MGITPRDLEAVNIMLTKAGAKLMDFGLAKKTAPAPLADALNEMTAEQGKLTVEGTIVGTFQYRAPEQLEGKEADAHGYFALGEVIYEMATGELAFAAKSRASLIVAILASEPQPMTALHAMTPLAFSQGSLRRWTLPAGTSKWQVSRGGGEPRWRRTVRSCFLFIRRRKMMACRLDWEPTSKPVRPGCCVSDAPSTTNFCARRVFL